MKITRQLLAVAAIAATSNARLITRDLDSTDSVCANGTVASATTVPFGDVTLQWTSFDCAAADESLLEELLLGLEGLLFPLPWFPWPIWGFPIPPYCYPPPPKPTKTTKTSATPTPTPTSINVCNVPCTDTCGHLGDLPPITEDCQQIFDSISIDDGSIAPTFDVLPNHIEQLTFGTCRVFFQNFSNKTQTYCWDTLSQQAQTAATDCFPPVQPVNSVGFCAPSDGSWQVGIAHS